MEGPCSLYWLARKFLKLHYNTGVIIPWVFMSLDESDEKWERSRVLNKRSRGLDALLDHLSDETSIDLWILAM